MRNTLIEHIFAREILDSRGNPTLAVRVTLADGTTAEAMVPSGASTGVHEAMELRDNDPQRYNGAGVLLACQNVNTTIAHALHGLNVLDMHTIDGVMLDLDGTPNKSHLGANAILGVSLAAARVGALSQDMPLYTFLRRTYSITKPQSLPIPMMNILNGGKHANNGLTFQESMIVPQQKTMHERIRCGAEIFHALKTILNERGFTTGVGDEGGFAPDIKVNEEAFALIAEAISKTQYTLGVDVFFAFDAAISEYYENGVYTVDENKMNAEQVIAYYEMLQTKYPFIGIEDGLAEDDWANWKIMTQRLGKSLTLIGDDLFVTNTERIQRGITEGVANAVLIKVNQIGSLTETIEAIQLAQANGYKVMISHRSGETEDTTIADLAVATGAEYIKTGSLSRSERIAKYNRLLAIESEWGGGAMTTLV